MAELTGDKCHLAKCGHASCKCLVNPGDSYCSEFCEKADDEVEKHTQSASAKCNCGHPDCK